MTKFEITIKFEVLESEFEDKEHFFNYLYNELENWKNLRADMTEVLEN